MKSRRTTLLSLGVAACVGAVVAFWLGSDYSLERRSQSQALIERGQAILTALEGGMRSHRRMNMWFRSSIKSTLDSMAAGPGIRALVIFDAQGNRLAEGGEMPDGLAPSPEPQWLSQGLLVCREARFDIPEEPPYGGRGRMWGPGWQQDSADELLQGPVRLAVLLDDSSCRQAQAKALRRLAFSLAVTLAAVLLGLALMALIQRQGRLAAELGLARERAGRLEELTRLGAGLAHETKNPLSLIRGLAQTCLTRLDSDGEARRHAQQIIDEADRVVGRINSFLDYSRPQQPRLQAVELDEVLGEMAAIFRDEASAKGVALRAETPPARVLADPDMLRQVIVNLLANALEACRKEDSILIRSGPNGRGRVSFAIRDTGIGIAAEDLPLVAKPYFTRREGGTGLGLAIVDQIAQAHGWRLEIESAKGQGATVRIAGLQEAAPE